MRSRDSYRPVHGQRPPDRYHARAGTGVLLPRHELTAATRPGRADPEARDAGRRQPVRRRAARRLRQAPRPELLPHLRPRVPAARPRPLPRRRVRRRTLDRLRRRRAEAADAALPPRRRLDPLDRRRRDERRSATACPKTLGEWIACDGLTHLKIKLNGDDLGWDVDRVRRASNAVAEAAQATARRHATGSTRSTSTSAARTSSICSSSCGRCKEQAPAGFDRVQYIEQPTARDLKANRAERHARGGEAASRWSSTNR